MDIVAIAQGALMELVGAGVSLMEQRLALCRGDVSGDKCPNYNVNGTCALCTCQLYKKARLVREHCPKKKDPLW